MALEKPHRKRETMNKTSAGWGWMGHLIALCPTSCSLRIVCGKVSAMRKLHAGIQGSVGLAVRLKKKETAGPISASTIP